MYIYDVVFKQNDSKTAKHYFYKSHMTMHQGGEYRIANRTREYSTPIIVVSILTSDEYVFTTGRNPRDLVEIIAVQSLTAIPVPDDRIKVVNFNRKKRVTAVKWTDGTVTKVTCQDMDPFDEEKALALCYMKRWCFDNRGCFNEAFKKHCHKEEQPESEEAKPELKFGDE